MLVDDGDLRALAMHVHPDVHMAGDQQRNRNVPNDPTKLVPIFGALEPGTSVAFEAAYGWWTCWRSSS